METNNLSYSKDWEVWGGHADKGGGRWEMGGGRERGEMGGGHWFLYNLLNVSRSVKSKLLLVSLPLYSKDVSVCLFI